MLGRWPSRISTAKPMLRLRTGKARGSRSAHVPGGGHRGPAVEAGLT
jgi:hypothetical protein